MLSQRLNFTKVTLKPFDDITDHIFKYRAGEKTPSQTAIEEVEPELNEQQQPPSLFTRNPFKEFTQKKFQELLQQENMEKLIEMREQALNARHQTQADYMNEMLKTKVLSPKTFGRKKIELEKWVTKEREQIRRSKEEIKKVWSSFYSTINKVCQHYFYQSPQRYSYLSLD